MTRKKNGSATYNELAVLASAVGLVENTDEGRKAFTAWMSSDLKAARKALFSRVATRRAAASAAKAPTHRPINAAEAQGLRTGESTRYPQAWAKGRSLGAAASVRSTGLTPRSAAASPTDARHTPRVPTITEGRD